MTIWAPGVTQQTTSAASALVARARLPAELGGEGSRGLVAGVVAGPGSVAGGGHAACDPRAVKATADDPDRPRIGLRQRLGCDGRDRTGAQGSD